MQLLTQPLCDQPHVQLAPVVVVFTQLILRLSLLPIAVGQQVAGVKASLTIAKKAILSKKVPLLVEEPAIEVLAIVKAWALGGHWAQLPPIFVVATTRPREVLIILR